MWVYLRTEPQLFTVGFYDPDGNFRTDSDHASKEDAADRVHWLNGGSLHDDSPKAEADEPNIVGPCESCGRPLDADNDEYAFDDDGNRFCRECCEKDKGEPTILHLDDDGNLKPMSVDQAVELMTQHLDPSEDDDDDQIP